MNNNSVNFIKERISKGEADADINMNDAVEINFKESFNALTKLKFDDANVVALKMSLCNQTNNYLILEYNPSEKFDYFIAKSCICDGTFLFVNDLMIHNIERLLTIDTYCKNTIPDELRDKFSEENLMNYDIRYVIGNFVFVEEYDEKFSTKEKPWMRSRFTVMLPLKCEFIKNK